MAEPSCKLPILFSETSTHATFIPEPFSAPSILIIISEIQKQVLYSPLDHYSTELRVLQLRPGKRDGPFVCTLSHIGIKTHRQQLSSPQVKWFLIFDTSSHSTPLHLEGLITWEGVNFPFHSVSIKVPFYFLCFTNLPNNLTTARDLP